MLLLPLMKLMFLYVLTTKSGMAKKCVVIDQLGNDGHTHEDIDTSICNKTYRVSHINVKPFDLLNIVEDLLKWCCNNLTAIKVIEFSDASKLTPKALHSSDFVYPILGHSSLSKVYDYHFLPYVNVQSTFYITVAPDLQKVLLEHCFKLWPLIVIALLMAAVAGFVGWTIETWNNKSQFPRTFLIGWSEGLWWSFISMTTVGYGDKTPKSVVGRIFSVAWILVGIITFNLVTGNIVSTIKNIESKAYPEIKGSVIGTIKHRLFEAAVIVSKGGILSETKSVNVFDGTRELLRKLRDKEIDGFLLDKYLFWYASERLKNDSLMEDFSKGKLVSKETYYEGEALSYGILVRDTANYEYFKNAIISNQLILEVRLMQIWNTLKHVEGEKQRINHMIDTNAYYYDIMIVLGVAIASICVLGIFYELFRRCWKMKSKINKSVEMIENRNTHF